MRIQVESAPFERVNPAPIDFIFAVHIVICRPDDQEFIGGGVVSDIGITCVKIRIVSGSGAADFEIVENRFGRRSGH